MLPPLPRRSVWAYCFAHSPSRISLPRKGCRVGLRIVRFEDCSAFTHVAACTLARSPIRDPLSEGFSHFVTSMAAPVASGWSGCRVGLAPTGKTPPFHGAHPMRTSADRAGARSLPGHRVSGYGVRHRAWGAVRKRRGETPCTACAGSGQSRPDWFVRLFLRHLPNKRRREAC